MLCGKEKLVYCGVKWEVADKEGAAWVVEDTRILLLAGPPLTGLVNSYVKALQLRTPTTVFGLPRESKQMSCFVARRSLAFSTLM